MDALENKIPLKLSETGLNLGGKLSVLNTSDGLGWPNVNVSLIKGVPYDELTHSAGRDLWLVDPLVPLDVRLAVGRETYDTVFNPRHIVLIAPGTSLKAKRRNDADCLHLFLKSELITEVASELFDRDARNIDFVSTFGFQDTGISNLMHSLKHTLLDPVEHSILKVEYLSRALAVDLLARRTSPSHDWRNLKIRERLTIRQARRVAHYIRENLSTDISLNELAGIAGVSRTIFTQRFKTSFQQTPHQYVIRARVSQAQEMLANTNMSMPQIALACGFSDQAHFSMRFNRIMGLTPSAYRKMTR